MSVLRKAFVLGPWTGQRAVFFSRFDPRPPTFFNVCSIHNVRQARLLSSIISSRFKDAANYEKAALARDAVHSYAEWGPEEKDAFAVDLAENLGLDEVSANRAVVEFTSGFGGDFQARSLDLRRLLVPQWECFFRTVLAEVPQGMSFLVKRELVDERRTVRDWSWGPDLRLLEPTSVQTHGHQCALFCPLGIADRPH